MIVVGETGNVVLLQNCVDIFVAHIQKNIEKDENNNQIVKKVDFWCVCATTLMEKNLKLATYSTQEQAEKYKEEILSILEMAQPVYRMPIDNTSGGETKANKTQEG